MATALLAMTVVAIPLAVVVGLLRLADRLQQSRDACHARQIELTDAIHRAMGAATAPTVERHRGGGWLVRMRVPFDRPATVAELLAVTGRVLGSPDTAGTLAIVLTQQVTSPGAGSRVSRGPRWQSTRSATPTLATVR
jgi:hypothetical protein